MKRSLIAAIAVAASGALSAGAWFAARHSKAPAPGASELRQATAADLAPRLLSAAQELLTAHRKIIVLLAGDEALAKTERDAVNVAGQALFHENQERLTRFESLLADAMKAAPTNGFGAIEGLLAYIESGTGLYDADRLAFREVLHALRRLAAADQTLPAIKLHKRISEDLDALTEIERQYERELKAIFARFDARAIDLKRERWDDYLAQLRKQFSREQILKDFGTIIPYPEPVPDQGTGKSGTGKGSAGKSSEGKQAAREEDGEIFGYSLPPKTVALTFDDGPHGVYTDEIAAILKQYNVPAAFFQVGRNLGSVTAAGDAKLTPRGEAAARKLLAGGHVLANHSFSHAQLSKQTGDALRAEIAQTDQLLKAADPKRSPLFRFPYGARNSEGMDMLGKLQLRSVMWNIDSQDWADPVPASIASRVLRTLEKEQRGIILFHDIHERTVKALPLVLERLVADGYRFAAWDGEKFRVTGEGKGLTDPRDARAGAPAIAVSPGYQNSWAVVIGIDEYAKWPRLQYAVRDAQALRQLLIERFGFANERVLMLTNRDATRANILALFNQQLGGGRVKRDDRIFVFFAGHGATRKLSSGRDLGYIVPVDSDPQQFSSDAIPMTELQNIAESLEAKHVLFVMDACYSGLGLTRGGPSRFLAENARRLGRQMLTAGGADQLVADGGPNGHSIFTWTLLQALGGKADLNGDGMITATELAAYVAPAVSGVSQQTPAFGSLPGSEGGEFVFEVQGDTESLTAQTDQLPADAIALNKRLDQPRAAVVAAAVVAAAAGGMDPRPSTAPARSTAVGPAAVMVKDLQGGEQQLALPKPVSVSARQLAQRANDAGLQLYREKRYAEAEAAFTEALKQRPDFGLAANNLGFVYFKQDKFAEAARWFENALRIDPSRALAYLNLGDARAKLGEVDKARQAYRTYLELAPGGAASAHVKAQIDKL